MKRYIFHLSALLASVCLSLLAGACSAIKDDDPEPCPQGLEVRFVYDYNLERANAFPAQVECLTLHLYDSEGNFVRTYTETSSVLADEEYRMIIDDLPEGTYHLLAYGGSTCDDASIKQIAEPREGSRMEESGMLLDPECLEPGNPKGHLHDHFYGTIDAEVRLQPTRTRVTVPMMKNTNQFRIILQHLGYDPLDGNDYDFEIVDDNTLFDHTNDLVANGLVTYTPWSQGSVATGVTVAAAPGVSAAPAGMDVTVAYADLSTSRLMTKRNPTLKVRYRQTGETIIDIPLNNYLLALRSDHFSWCGEQEFLDRKSDWPLIFFMDDDVHWNKAYIKVGPWEVRINEISQ